MKTIKWGDKEIKLLISLIKELGEHEGITRFCIHSPIRTENACRIKISRLKKEGKLEQFTSPVIKEEIKTKKSFINKIISYFKVIFKK